MIIDEIRNSKFNFQLNIITTLIFGNQCCLFQELTVGSLLSLSFPSTMIYKNQTGKRQNENTQKEQTIHPENGSNYFRFGIFEDNFFLISELNSFQQLEMSIPFLRFIMWLEICVPGFRLSMNRASLTFLCWFLVTLTHKKWFLVTLTQKKEVSGYTHTEKRGF